MKKVNMRDVASLAGVSVATVSYVINGKKGKVSPQTVAKIEQIIEQLDYSLDIRAATLAKGTSRLIGVALPITEKDKDAHDLLESNPFFSEYISGIKKVFKNTSYDILLTEFDVKGDYRNWIRGRNLDGIILLGIFPLSIYEEILKLQIPSVFTDVYDDFGPDAINIRSDDQQGIIKAIDHLAKLGHRHIAFISGSKSTSKINAIRYQGYLEGLKSNNLPFNEKFVLETLTTFNAGREIGYKLWHEMNEITAAICAADILAIGILKTLQERGIAVPKQFSIIGFDDLQLSGFLYPGLTTIRQHISQKGEVAGKTLLDIMVNKKDIEPIINIPTQLIIRGTTGKVWPR